jgi:hypothetical protein
MYVSPSPCLLVGTWVLNLDKDHLFMKKNENKILVCSIMVVFQSKHCNSESYLLTMNKEKAKFSQSTIQLPFLLYTDPKLPTSQKCSWIKNVVSSYWLDELVNRVKLGEERYWNEGAHTRWRWAWPPNLITPSVLDLAMRIKLSWAVATLVKKRSNRALPRMHVPKGVKKVYKPIGCQTRTLLTI